MSRPSIRQLASAMGVSPATVSRVLNEQPGVSEATRERVLQAVREIGYPSPWQSGRNSPLVGIVLPEPDNPIFAVLAGTIEAALARYGVDVLVASSATLGVSEKTHIDTFLRHGAHGLVVVSGVHADPSQDHSEYHRLADRGVALVLVNGTVDGLRIPTVQADHAVAAAMAVRYLCWLGHERIGLANGEPYLYPSVNRLAGFRTAMCKLVGRCHEDLIIEQTYTIAGGHRAGQQLVAAGATAVVAGSDLIAIGVVQAARELGKHVPGEVSVVGHDDSYLAALTNPPLTTIHQPIDKMSAAVAQAMWQQLQGLRPPRLRFVVSPRLVVRGSTAPAQTPLSRRDGHKPVLHPPSSA